MALDDEARQALLSALRENKGRLSEAIETAGLEAADVMDLLAVTSKEYDPEFADAVLRLERVRLLALEETIWGRADRGSTAAAQEISRRKTEDERDALRTLTRKEREELDRARKASEAKERAGTKAAEKAAGAALKKANGKAEPDPAAAGAARLLTLTSGRG